MFAHSSDTSQQKGVEFLGRFMERREGGDAPTSDAPATHSTTRSSSGVSRGHALTSDGGWREVADTALAFVQRLTERGGSHAY
jgi:hypothetical protein